MVNAAEEYLTPFLAGFPGFLWVRNKEHRIVFINENLKHWLNFHTNVDLLGMTYEEVMSTNVLSSCFITYVYHHNLATDVSAHSSANVIECKLKDNTLYFDVIEFDTVINTETFYYTVAKDITDLYCEKEQYQHISLIDDLSGLYNKRFFNNYYFANKSTIILIDLDNFKHVNDDYGHVKGDELIKKFSSLLRSTFRSEDSVIRYGGDEFVIITENNNVSVIKNRIKLINEKISNDFGDLSFVSFSYGAENYQGDIVKTMNIIDKKMYENKKSKL